MVVQEISEKTRPPQAELIVNPVGMLRMMNYTH